MPVDLREHPEDPLGGGARVGLGGRIVPVPEWARELGLGRGSAVLTEEPGAGLALAVETLDPDTLTTKDLVDAVDKVAQLASWTHARMLALIAALHQRPEMNRQWDRLAGPTPAQRSVTADVLSFQLGISRPTANSLVHESLALTGNLSATGHALATGHIDPPKARLMTQRLWDTPWQIATAVEDRVLPDAGERTLTQLGKDIERALLIADPTEAAPRRTRARADRKITHPRVLPDGMASMHLILPAVDATRIDSVLNTAARTAKTCGDPRTLDQLRTDGLRDLIIHTPPPPWPTTATPPTSDPSTASTARTTGTARAAGAAGAARAALHAARTLLGQIGIEPHTTPDTPTDSDPRAPAPVPDNPDLDPTVTTGTDGSASAGASVEGTGSGSGESTDPPTVTISVHTLRRLLTRPRPGAQIQVTIAASTLLGMDDLPADLHNYGPIDATTARALAADGEWRRIVTDPLTGTVLDYGRTRYRPPHALTEHIHARDKHCAAPGCTIPATRTDLDHTIEYHPQPHTDNAPLGTTSADNLGPLCRRHHQLKTNGGFTLHQPAPGIFEWTTPTGHRHLVRPGSDQTHQLHNTPDTPAELDPPPF